MRSLLPQVLVNSLIAGSLYTLVALGFNLLYSTTRFFNLTLGAMIALAGYIVLLLLGNLGLPLWAGIILGVLGAGVFGVVTDICIFSPLRKKKASPMVSLVASLGAYTVIQALLAIFFTSQFQSLSKFFNRNQVFSVSSASITTVQVAIIISAIAASIVIWLMLKYTLFGKSVTALSDDEEVSKIVGINTSRVQRWIFFIASMLAGLAGILLGLDTGIEPIMGMPRLLDGIISAIIGGMGNPFASIMGGMILGFAENFGIIYIDGEWKAAISYGILILFLLFRPQGIFKR